MHENTKLKALLGAALVSVASLLILFVSSQGEPVVPGILGSVAALVMAAGVLLLGTAGSDGRPV